MAESYYAARSRRDPEWREEAIAGALERERARREADPEAFRARRREASARSRARQVEHGFTFTELLRGQRGRRNRSPVDDPVTLRLVLADEVRQGRVDYCGSSRRYVLNGALPEDVKAALSELDL